MRDRLVVEAETLSAEGALLLLLYLAAEKLARLGSQVDEAEALMVLLLVDVVYQAEMKGRSTVQGNRAVTKAVKVLLKELDNHLEALAEPIAFLETIMVTSRKDWALSETMQVPD